MHPTQPSTGQPSTGQPRTSQLGGTGLEITRVGFGAWAIGGGGWQFGWGPQQDKESIAAVRRALELGINWIDTAAGYGFGRSERVVGAAPAGLSDRPYGFTNRGSVLAEAEASLERLGIDAIDLYQIHWPVPEDDIEQGWSALAELKERGLVRHIGVCNFTPAQLRRIASIAPVETLQPPYSLVDRCAEDEVLPFAEREGIGVIVYSPMGSGLLTGAMTRERIARLSVDDWRAQDPPLHRATTVAPPGTGRTAAGGRRPPRRHTGRGRLDPAQPGRRRRDHRIPPARPGGPEHTQVIFSMVTDDQAQQAVSHGPDGILAGLAPGTVYLDMSPVSPQTGRDLAEQVRAHGATMLDAPVSGSITAAADVTLAIMVGGPQDAFDTVEPLLHRFARAVDHVGGNGQGLLLKLAINISLAAQMLAFSEGVLLAERGGIDPARAGEVMTRSAIGSPMVRARAPLRLDLPDQAWFDVRLMHKDIRLALRTGHELGVRLPSATTADAQPTDAEQQGYAHRDIAALFQVLARSPATPHTTTADRPASTPAVPAASHRSTS